jgi:hypothetical protein
MSETKTTFDFSSWSVAPKSPACMEVKPKNIQNPSRKIQRSVRRKMWRKIRTGQILNPTKTTKPTVLEVALKYNWKVGDKGIRQVGHGEMPDPGEQVKLGGWTLMRICSYPGIVTEEALDRAKILLDEGADIKGLLIANDRRSQVLREIRQRLTSVLDTVLSIDWNKHKTTITQGVSTVLSAITSKASALTGQVKTKADEVNWEEVKEVSGKGLRVIGLGIVSIAAGVVVLPIIAAAVLPILAVAVIPFALIYDPWLIAVDSENRFWVIAEWYD